MCLEIAHCVVEATAGSWRSQIPLKMVCSHLNEEERHRDMHILPNYVDVHAGNPVLYKVSASQQPPGLAGDGGQQQQIRSVRKGPKCDPQSV